MNFGLQQWVALAPILVVSLTIITVMLGIGINRNHWWNATLAVAGLNVALLACLFTTLVAPQVVTPLLVVDGFALFYTALVLVATLACATLSNAYLDGYEGNQEEMYLLLLLSALGGIVMVSSRHLASFFIGLELLTVPLYAMIGYPLRSRNALEAALKYLLLSAGASAFLLFGMALVYAQCGHLSFAGIGRYLQNAPDAPGLIRIGGAMMLVGIGFKLSLVPFHLWTPDVYQGAPAPVTAFLATASKTAVFAVLLRLMFEAQIHSSALLLDVLTALAMLSMIAGNVLALLQNNVKRMLAYSSIAHFGYCLVPLIAGGALAVEAVGMYLLTYVVTTLGAFGVVTLVSSPMHARDADAIYDYRGLFWRRPYLASILTMMLLSLAGIPATAGFIGKFYAVAAGVDAREWLLLGGVILGSAIGLFYYLRLMVTLFLMDRDLRRFDAPRDWAQHAGGAMILGVAVTMLLLGLYPQPFIQVLGMAGLASPN